MACAALLRENCVRRRQRAAAIDTIVAGQREPSEPDQGEEGNADGQERTQAAKGMRALEIIHVDALGQFFCREPGSGHDASPLF